MAELSALRLFTPDEYESEQGSSGAFRYVVQEVDAERQPVRNGAYRYDDQAKALMMARQLVGQGVHCQVYEELAFSVAWDA